MNYTCKCGKSYEKTSLYAAHTGHCKIYREGKEPIDRFGESRAWAKGLTKEDPRLKKFIESAHKKDAVEKRSKNRKNTENSKKRIEGYSKQSKTRKEKYENGQLSPAKGVGRGKYSYIAFNNKKIKLRSTYEFIFCLNLLLNGIDFEYETIRVKYEDKVYISDFLIDDKIYEVKGFVSSKSDKVVEAFQYHNYNIELVLKEDIDKMKESLIEKGIEINTILEKIVLGHNNKNYYVYQFN